MAEEPPRYYGTKEEALRAAAQKVAAGARPEELAVVSTDFGDSSFRWSVRTVESPTPAAPLQLPYINIEKLQAEKRVALWNVAGQSIGIAALSTVLVAFPLSVSCLPAWVVVPICVGVFIGVAKQLFSMVAPKDIFEPVEGFDCPNEECRKYVAADDSWICGHCDAVNIPERKQSYGFDFIFSNWLTQCCCKCSYQATAYLCHHCGKIIFLGPRCSDQHPARAANRPCPPPKSPTIQEVHEVSSANDWKVHTESQIEGMVAEKMAFSAITQKVCELRDAQLKRIEEDATMDELTKSQLKEFEKQWANKKLQDLKMRVVKAK